MTESQKLRFENAKKIYDEFIKLYPFTLDDLDGEIWRDIPDYENLYQESNFGRTKSFWRVKPKILRPGLIAPGYLAVWLYKDSKMRAIRVHKLVEKAFSINPDNKPEIDHIDGNKFNNYVGNLRPVTSSENKRYAVERRNEIAGLPAPIWDLQTDLVLVKDQQVYASSLKIAEIFGKRHDNIIQAIENCLAVLRAGAKSNVLKIKDVKMINPNGIEKAFIKGEYKDAKGEMRPMYYLNRDAFSFVVMGFTGEKAAIWKWNYIQTFNAMEKALRRLAV